MYDVNLKLHRQVQTNYHPSLPLYLPTDSISKNRIKCELYHVENLLFDEMKKISVLYQTNLQLDFNRAGSLKHQHTLCFREEATNTNFITIGLTK
jgi:hypothetical protein